MNFKHELKKTFLNRFSKFSLVGVILVGGFTTASAQVPTNGLVGLYPMAGNGSDVSAAGNNLIFTGTESDPSFGTDRFGNEMAAMHFNGFQFANMPDMNLGNNFTITMWLKSEVVNTRMPISGASYPNDPFQFLDLIVTGGSVDGTASFLFRAYDGSYDAELGPMTASVSAATPALLENDWYFVVMRNNNGTVSLQIDDIMYPMQNEAAAMNSLQMVLGQRAGAGSYEYQGFIDDLTVHNVALSNEDVEIIRQTEIVVPPASWSVSIQASANQAYDSNARFGASEDATDSYDATLDVPAAPPSPNGDIRVYFSHPEFESPFGEAFAGDVRGWYNLATTYKTWQVNVASSNAGTAYVNFLLPENFEFPIRITHDQTGEFRNMMTGIAGFSFEFEGAEIHTFTVTVGDNTAPEVTHESNTHLDGYQTFVAGSIYMFGYNGSDESGLGDGTLEISYDNFETSEFLAYYNPNGKESNVQTYRSYNHAWNIATDFAGYKPFRLRVRVPDVLGNVTEIVTSNMLFSPIQEATITPGWNLTGVPFASVNGGKAENLADDISGYFASYDWTGYSYETTDNLSSGKGFWLGAMQEATVQLNGNLALTEQYVTTQGGWQIISSPFVLTSSVNDLTVKKLATNEFVPFYAAVDSGWVTLPFGYNKQDGSYYEETTLNPFTGVWVGFNADNHHLIWSAPEVFPKKQIRSTPAVSEEAPVLLSMTARDKSGVLSTVRFGYHSKGTSGYDVKLDQYTPPVPPTGVVVSLEGVQTMLGNRFGRLVFRGNETVQTRVRIEGAKNESVVLNWEGGNLSGKATLIAGGVSYDLKTSGSATVTVGAEVFIELSPSTTSSDKTDLPNTFALGQNYPNPFNPSTSISYAVPAASDVKLSVFNMLGQEVSVLVNGRMSAGNHTVSFDASKLASGVYMYRMQSGSFVQMKKMTLMK